MCNLIAAHSQIMTGCDIKLLGQISGFMLMHKIRVYIGKRYALYTLSDMVEYDDCFVTVATKRAESVS